jgi:hypothetical protein
MTLYFFATLRLGSESGPDFPQFKARITPIRASIVGPPRSATRIMASIAACHSGASCSFFGSRAMYLPASRNRLRLSGRQSGLTWAWPIDQIHLRKACTLICL